MGLMGRVICRYFTRVHNTRVQVVEINTVENAKDVGGCTKTGSEWMALINKQRDSKKTRGRPAHEVARFELSHLPQHSLSINHVRTS